MLDTARHYLSISAIERMIDAAAYTKMNTLHWHTIDAESFPMVSPSYLRHSDLTKTPSGLRLCHTTSILSLSVCSLSLSLFFF
jgi:hypothetical protein